MKNRLRLVTLVSLCLALPVGAGAAPSGIMVLFNGNTEVNRHTFNFLGQTLGSGGYQVSATLNPATIKAGQYKAVIVVSTRTTSGLDPVLAAFIQNYPAKKELYLVSLLSRTGSLTVTTFSAATGAEGVDGVTAATTWSRGSQLMHSQWMQALVTALAAR